MYVILHIRVFTEEGGVGSGEGVGVVVNPECGTGVGQRF